MSLTLDEKIKTNFIKYNWFKDVGGDFPFIKTFEIKKIETWKEAVAWSEQKITWWCGNECFNILTSYLDSNFRKEYQSWNKIVKEASEFVDSIIEDRIIPKIPGDYSKSKILKWVKYQLVGSVVEEVYLDLFDIQVFSNVKMVYKSGFFPCGLFVEREADFPEKTIIVVF